MPNPTTANEEPPMPLNDTITKLRALLFVRDDWGKRYFERQAAEHDIYDLLPQLLTAIESRESEKPKKTDEDLVEAMCKAYYNHGKSEDGYLWRHAANQHLIRDGMRAALDVVREEMK